MPPFHVREASHTVNQGFPRPAPACTVLVGPCVPARSSRRANESPAPPSNSELFGGLGVVVVGGVLVIRPRSVASLRRGTLSLLFILGGGGVLFIHSHRGLGGRAHHSAAPTCRPLYDGVRRGCPAQAGQSRRRMRTVPGQAGDGATSGPAPLSRRITVPSGGRLRSVALPPNRGSFV